ncbi:MAG TPA: hypothetical protein VFW33_05655 [Gemmataceae bacterium]|nr:hypothetical protein [Gemmataceae bacterium]
MTQKLHWALLCVLAVPSVGATADEEVKNAARVKWARGILADFWDASRTGECRQVEALISPELARAFQKTESNSIDFGFHTYLNTKQYDSYKVLSEVVDPDGVEVLFTGEVTGKNVKGDFKARVVREAASGKWCIRMFTVKERKDATKSEPAEPE